MGIFTSHSRHGSPLFGKQSMTDKCDQSKGGKHHCNVAMLQLSSPADHNWSSVHRVVLIFRWMSLHSRALSRCPATAATSLSSENRVVSNGPSSEDQPRQPATSLAGPLSTTTNKA